MCHCSNETLAENFERNLVGATRACLQLVKRVRPGMPIFMFNISDKRVFGVFEAVSGAGPGIPQRDGGSLSDAFRPRRRRTGTWTSSLMRGRAWGSVRTARRSLPR